MFCKNCGKQIDNGVQFCPHCGMYVQSEVQQSAAPAQPAQASQPSYNPQTPVANGETAYSNPNVATAQVVENKPPKVWTVFAKIGKILGIVCLSTALIPYINYFSLSFAIAGIVFSCLGRKAKNAESDKNCSIGLKLSIAATVVSLVMIIVYLLIFEVLIIAASGSGEYYY